MKGILLLLSFSIFLAKACDTADDFTLGESFTMEPGQELKNTTADLTVKWLEVAEDSRCPKNTNCVWEGQAKVSLLINGDPLTLTLRDGKPEEASANKDGYVFEAQQLDPYPDGAVIDPTQYRLQLLVSSL